MLAYRIRMDVGNGRPGASFLCGCGPSQCLDKCFFQNTIPPSQPYYVGDDWVLRFKVENAVTGAAIDLTGKLILATFKRYTSDIVGVLRRSDTDIVGSAPPRKQIAIDPQAVDFGPAGIQGRGWFELRFGHERADFCQMLSLVGEVSFDLRIQDLTTGVMQTLMEGCFGVYRPKTLLTTPAIIPPVPPIPPSPSGGGTGTYNCPPAMVVGAFVYLSGADFVDLASAASIATAPAWGIVLAKPTLTTATVLFGDDEVGGFVGLTPTAQYFLDVTPGAATASVGGFVTGNIIQKVGRAKSATVLVIEIDNDFVIL